MLMPTPTALSSRRRLENAAGDAGAMQHQPQRQAADAGADNEHFHAVDLRLPR